MEKAFCSWSRPEEILISVVVAVYDGGYFGSGSFIPGAIMAGSYFGGAHLYRGYSGR